MTPKNIADRLTRKYGSRTGERKARIRLSRWVNSPYPGRERGSAVLRRVVLWARVTECFPER